jgi:adenosylcobinamide-phosphate synthase
MLVGRDTERLDAAGCNRAAIESLGENLTDSVVAPLFYFTLFGLLGLLAFKVVSTADSMVGYKSERFRRVGWASARADDVLAFVPARLTWLLVVLAAAVLPGMSGRDAARCGVRQHALVPGPNAGWSEASTAGALRLRLVGDVWRDGVKVVDGIWLGREEDREAATLSDVRRAVLLIGVTTFLFMVVAFLVLAVAGVVPWPERLLAPWPPFGSTA